MLQPVANSPAATVQAGGVWESINAGLNSALNVYAQVETIKATNAASGQDQIQARVVPELENGAAVAVDASLPATNDSNFIVGGVAVNKNIIYATGLIILTIAGYKAVK